MFEDALGTRTRSGGGERLDDLDVYVQLVKLADALSLMSQRCWSLSSATGMAAASLAVRKLASAIYLAQLAGDD
jgi:hypothetical protein